VLRIASCVAVVAAAVLLATPGSIGVRLAPVADPAAVPLKLPISWHATRFVTPEEMSAATAAALATDIAGHSGPALPELYTGIGPGSALIVGSTVGAQEFLCTAAFVFKDSTGDYYLGTAGHCLVRDETDTTAYSGYVDNTKTNNEVDICVQDCLDNALEVGTYVRLYTGMSGAPSGYDPVLFGQSGGIGTDFGLIRIPSTLDSQLRPWMPQFGGPTGQASSTSTGQLIAHYGHGTYCCPVVGGVASRTPVDQGRIAMSLGSDANSFEFAGWGTGGDSGSGMELATASTNVVTGGNALGVLTHGLITSGIGYGTLVQRGLDMVHSYRAAHTGLPSSTAGPVLVKGTDTI